MVKKLSCLVLFITVFIFNSISFAQEEEWLSSVEYDEASGNYIVKYGTPDHMVTVIYELPNKVNGLITATTKFKGEEIFEYEYKVFNQQNSLQDMSAFYIDTEVIVENAEKPQGWSFFELFNNKPFAWWAAIRGAKYRVKPGNQAEGFMISGKSIPGIVTCYFEGYVKGPIFPEEYPDEIGEALLSI